MSRAVRSKSILEQLYKRNCSIVSTDKHMEPRLIYRFALSSTHTQEFDLLATVIHIARGLV